MNNLESLLKYRLLFSRWHLILCTSSKPPGDAFSVALWTDCILGSKRSPTGANANSLHRHSKLSITTRKKKKFTFGLKSYKLISHEELPKALKLWHGTFLPSQNYKCFIPVLFYILLLRRYRKMEMSITRAIWNHHLLFSHTSCLHPSTD